MLILTQPLEQNSKTHDESFKRKVILVKVYGGGGGNASCTRNCGTLRPGKEAQEPIA
jgi:hypothetical protein